MTGAPGPRMGNWARLGPELIVRWSVDGRQETFQLAPDGRSFTDGTRRWNLTPEAARRAR